MESFTTYIPTISATVACQITGRTAENPFSDTMQYRLTINGTIITGSYELHETLPLPELLPELRKHISNKLSHLLVLQLYKDH